MEPVHHAAPKTTGIAPDPEAPVLRVARLDVDDAQLVVRNLPLVVGVQFSTSTTAGSGILPFASAGEFQGESQDLAPFSFDARFPLTPGAVRLDFLSPTQAVALGSAGSVGFPIPIPRGLAHRNSTPGPGRAAGRAGAAR